MPKTIIAENFAVEWQDPPELGGVPCCSRRGWFGIREQDRRRHLAIVDQTGMGKPMRLRFLIVSDIAAGRGVGLIDPHEKLLRSAELAVVRAVPTWAVCDAKGWDLLR